MDVTTKLGYVGLKPIGEYSPETAYRKLHVVTYAGSSYMALKDVVGIAPTDDGINWQLVAHKGDKGDPYTESAEFAQLAQQVRDDRDSAAASASTATTQATTATNQAEEATAQANLARGYAQSAEQRQLFGTEINGDGSVTLLYGDIVII